MTDDLPTPTQTGYRVLWVLAGQARSREALRSELVGSFATDVSTQALGRTLDALADADYVRTTSDDEQVVITSRGRHVAFKELAGALDHCDLSAAMSAVGHRLAYAEPTTQSTPPRRTVLRGDDDDDVRTDGGRKAVPPTHDTPLTYQMACGSCGQLIGMSAKFCKSCGTKVDHAEGNQDPAVRRLLTGGDE